MTGAGGHEPPSPGASDDPYRRYLLERFQGEVYGEALFRTLAERCDTQSRARKWRALERLEVETQRAIADALDRCGAAARPDAEQIELGVRHGEERSRVPWLALLRDFRAELEALVGKLERGEKLARTAAEADVLRRITAHERALLEWAVRELDGRADSLEPVYAMLERTD